MSHFLVTTPIYYPNGRPHIGHAYASLIADVLAQRHRQIGDEVRLSTWVDENSQKIVMQADAEGIPLAQYLDQMGAEHESVWKGIGISYTDFVRTSHPSQRATVQEMLRRSFEKWDIYEGIYEWAYCVGCEAFKKESDLIEGKCPDHPKMSVQHLKEKNYFFRLSKYADRILELYEQYPDFVLPSSRFNEIKEFVRSGLEDFSISRESNKVGIPLPFAPEHVTYVWYDALFNYVSICVENGELGAGGEINDFWPAAFHVVGKDIIRFHGIYWPAMLMSADLPIPRHIVTTGYFTVNGLKMGKSNGNALDPVELVNKYGRDFLVLGFFLGAPIGTDSDFSEKVAIEMFNAKLANNLGNLTNRLTVLAEKVDSMVAPRPSTTIQNALTEYRDFTKSAFDQVLFKDILEKGFELADMANKRLDESKPWKMDPVLQWQEIRAVLWDVAAVLMCLSQELSAFFPQKMAQLSGIFTPNNEGIGIAKKGEPLFARIEIAKVEPSSK